MDEAGYKWAEQTANGRSGLEMDRGSWKWMEQATNGPERAAIGWSRL